LSCATVNEQRAFHELATIKAGENYLAPKIKLLGLVALAPYDALFQYPIRANLWAFRPSSISPRMRGWLLIQVLGAVQRAACCPMKCSLHCAPHTQPSSGILPVAAGLDHEFWSAIHKNGLAGRGRKYREPVQLRPGFEGRPSGISSLGRVGLGTGQLTKENGAAELDRPNRLRPDGLQKKRSRNLKGEFIMRALIIPVAAIVLAFSAVVAPAQTGGASGTSGGAAAKSGSDATAPPATGATGGTSNSMTTKKQKKHKKHP
jgi:hypothetical protein